MQRLLAAFFAVAIAAPALAQQGPPQTAPMMNTASAGDKALVGAMDKMNSQTALPLSGDTDQDFARLAVAERQNAVAMAKAELQYGKDPFLQKLAQQTITADSAQITQIQAWQARHPLGKK